MFVATTFTALVLSVLAPAAADDPAGAPARAAPQEAAPKTAQADPLEEGRRLKRSATGQEGAAKHSALTSAAQEFERVALASGGQGELAADASLRAGEIWRTLKQEEAARRCFERAAALAKAAPRFAARAWLEIGHLDRRAKRHEAALAGYQKVVELRPEQPREAAQALTWQGKVRIAMGQVPEGHALLLAVGQRWPELHLEDVRNVDLVACDWIEAGRVAEARALVAECLERHAEPDAGEEEVDEAVRRAMDKMKSRARLGELGPGEAGARAGA